MNTAHAAVSTDVLPHVSLDFIDTTVKTKKAMNVYSVLTNVNLVSMQILVILVVARTTGEHPVSIRVTIVPVVASRMAAPQIAIIATIENTTPAKEDMNVYSVHGHAHRVTLNIVARRVGLATGEQFVSMPVVHVMADFVILQQVSAPMYVILMSILKWTG